MGPKDTYNECLWASGGCPVSVEVICKQVYTACMCYVRQMALLLYSQKIHYQKEGEYHCFKCSIMIMMMIVANVY